MSTGEYITLTNQRHQFAETEALIAVMDGDSEQAQEIIAEFLPEELARFASQLDFLRDIIARVWIAR